MVEEAAGRAGPPGATRPAAPAWRERELPAWALPAAGAGFVSLPLATGLAGLLPWPLAWRTAVLAAELPLVFFAFCNVWQVGLRREYAWAAAFVISVGGSLLTWGRLPLAWLVPGHLGLAAWLCWAAWRDPFVQLARAIQALEKREMETASRAYGRYLMLGETLGQPAWESLRRSAIKDPGALRPRFAGMVNACRYGDLHGLGDLAYRSLFPEAGEGKASAEEG